MGIDFYYLPGSSPCRAVQMTAKAVGVELNLKLTDLMAGEHLKPEFLKVMECCWFYLLFFLSRLNMLRIYIIDLKILLACLLSNIIISFKLFIDKSTTYKYYYAVCHEFLMFLQ